MFYFTELDKQQIFLFFDLFWSVLSPSGIFTFTETPRHSNFFQRDHLRSAVGIICGQVLFSSQEMDQETFSLFPLTPGFSFLQFQLLTSFSFTYIKSNFKIIKSSLCRISIYIYQKVLPTENLFGPEFDFTPSHSENQYRITFFYFILLENGHDCASLRGLLQRVVHRGFEIPMDN